jgi:hypothetical protein
MGIKLVNYQLHKGIITCIPTGDKPRQYMKKWRPISLLNTVSPSKFSLISSDNVGMPVYGISFFRFILLTVSLFE